MDTLWFDMSENPDPELIQKATGMGCRVELRRFHNPVEDELMSDFKPLDTGTDPFAI